MQHRNLGGLVVALTAWTSSAHAIPDATTQVSKFCKVFVGTGPAVIEQESAVERPSGQNTQCDFGREALDAGNNVVGSAGAEGVAGASFFDRRHLGQAYTRARTYARSGTADADATSRVTYSFEIQPIAGFAGPPPATVPVVFSAFATADIYRAAHASSHATGSVRMSGALLDADDVLFSYDLMVEDEVPDAVRTREDLAGGFDGSRHVGLLPGAIYTVAMNSTCGAQAAPLVAFDFYDSAWCQSIVQPTHLTFDQAAFDAAMGAGSFPLANAYRLVYSANIPIPEPATATMLWAGLLMLYAGSRRLNAQRRASPRRCAPSAR